jgi:thiosulfate reductase cytochrome b subunit
LTVCGTSFSVIALTQGDFSGPELLSARVMSFFASTATHVDRRCWMYRHSAFVRVTHGINVICLTALLMSGLQIFNAHSALYWGEDSDFKHPVFAITADGNGALPTRGMVDILGRSFDATGVLGLSAGPSGRPVARAFPSWITLPGYQDLATGRRWHFFFAWLFVLNGAAYLLVGLLDGHFQRHLLPDRIQLRHIGRSILDHLALRFPKGEEARQYNVLQKLSYLLVIFILLPTMALAGMAMSPAIDAAVPQLVSLFDGRQSARTVHFIVATALVLFVLVHVLMVVLSGAFKNLRSMITGWFAIEAGDHDAKQLD